MTVGTLRELSRSDGNTEKDSFLSLLLDLLEQILTKCLIEVKSIKLTDKFKETRLHI